MNWDREIFSGRVFKSLCPFLNIDRCRWNDKTNVFQDENQRENVHMNQDGIILVFGKGQPILLHISVD